MKRILITGAIGQSLRACLAGVYRLLRLADIKPIKAITADEEGVTGDLTEFSAVRSMTGIIRAFYARFASTKSQSISMPKPGRSLRNTWLSRIRARSLNMPNQTGSRSGAPWDSTQ